MTEIQLKETSVEFGSLIDKAIDSTSHLIALDEIVHALNFELVQKEQLMPLFEKDIEIVFTVRDSPEWLLEKADYISDVKKVDIHLTKVLIQELVLRFGIKIFIYYRLYSPKCFSFYWAP